MRSCVHDALRQDNPENEYHLDGLEVPTRATRQAGHSIPLSLHHANRAEIACLPCNNRHKI